VPCINHQREKYRNKTAYQPEHLALQSIAFQILIADTYHI